MHMLFSPHFATSLLPTFLIFLNQAQQVFNAAPLDQRTSSYLDCICRNMHVLFSYFNCGHSLCNNRMAKPHIAFRIVTTGIKRNQIGGY